MAKILLVEDDNNLREIYEARLQAEGYDIVSARDGEEALTVAIKERPDLIISDVMMPKISGFDMLDIIRSTEETKSAKVIMMTALSQAEDKERAEKLGADRYLVKSQVTLEDVAKVAKEVLSGESSHRDEPASEPLPSTPPPQPAVEAPRPQPLQAEETTDETAPAPQPVDKPAPETNNTPATTVAEPVQTPAVPVSTPPAAAVPVTAPQADDTSTPVAMSAVSGTSAAQDDDNASSQSTAQALADNAGGMSLQDEQSAIAAQIESFIETKKTNEAPQEAETAAEATPKPENPAEVETEIKSETSSEQATPAEESAHKQKKVIQPINDLTASSSVDLESLAKKEAEKEEMADIAKRLSSQPEAIDKTDELAAAAALKEAAQTEKPPTTTGAEPSDAPDITVTEDGNLQVLADPSEDIPADTVATTEPATPAETPQPLIPHTNGTNIDGVAPTPSPASNPETPPEKTSEVNPNIIAL